MIRTLIVLVTVALSSAALAAAAGPPAFRSCGTVGGAHWKLKGQHGSVYRVRASGSTSCALARSAVPTLTHANTHSSGRALPGTPRGYTCVPVIAEHSGIGVLAGVCTKGDNPLNGGFSWAPVGLHI
jgi:hypothetical protein